MKFTSEGSGHRSQNKATKETVRASEPLRLDNRTFIMTKIRLFMLELVLVGWVFLQLGCGFNSGPASVRESFESADFGEPTDWEYVEANDTTEVTLASGKKMFLKGRFDVRSTLWGNNSLVYWEAVSFNCYWRVLNAEHDRGRSFYRESQASGLPSVLSRDGNTCFLWLDLEKQLTAVDVASGKMRSLTNLPTIIVNYKGDRYMDPAPAPNCRDTGPGVVHDPEANRVLFVLEESPNEDVFFWDRRPGRGGYQIVAVDLEDTRMTALSGPHKLKGEVDCWDMSLKRKEVYIYRQHEDQRFLEVRKFDGKLVRKLPLPKETINEVRLSPEEKTLLLDLRQGYTFVLIDLETNQVTQGPRATEGDSWSKATWSPDGKTIAYLRPWQLWLYDVESGKSSLLAWREPPTAGDRCPGSKEPAWSRDGGMLAVNIGGPYPKGSEKFDAPTLIVDLKQNAAMIFPLYANNMLWVPHPHAFGSE